MVMEESISTLLLYFLNILFFGVDSMRFPKNYEWENHMFEEGFTVGLDWGLVVGVILGIITGAVLGWAFL